MKRLVLAGLVIGMIGATAFAAKVERRTLRSAGRDRTYYLFVPDGLAKERPAPLIVTLHGSGRDGASLVEKWKDLATKEGIILAGPDATNSRQWAYPDDGPVLLRDLVEEIKANYPVDGRRVYLFGHSAGAGFAIQMGLLESDYIAAVATHAGTLVASNHSLVSIATRKIPFAMFVGTKDPNLPVAVVRETRDVLQKAGFVADLTEIPGHTHDYYSKAAIINRDVWAFLAKNPLPHEPQFTAYGNM